MHPVLRLALAALSFPFLAYGGLISAVGRDGVWPFLWGSVDHVPTDFRTLVPPGARKYWLVCPPGLNPAADAVSPVFTVPPARLRAAINALLDREGARRLIGGDAQIEVEVRTPALRFPDWVAIRVLPASEGSTLAIYSRSVYGGSDFGTNRRRVEAWLTALRAALE